MMDHRRFVAIAGALLLMGLLLPTRVLAGGGPTGRPLISRFNTVLEPGVWHGWVMRPSSECGGYLVKVTPLARPAEGAYVEKAVVQPEFDGNQWNDVLRVMIPSGQRRLWVNIRVYQMSMLPVATEFEATLQPGDSMAWVVGPSTEDRGYIVEVTPLEPSIDGAYVKSALVQEEWDGNQWNDVLRVSIPEGTPPFRAHLRVYSTAPLPVVGEYQIQLEPGVLGGVRVRRSAVPGALIAEINPLYPASGGEYVEERVIRPEFGNGVWSDLVLMRSPADERPLDIEVRVYGWPM
jgi:hypothetical protein